MNRTIFTGDNLDVMRGLDSDSVDLIYLDPPFNSNKTYSAPIGSLAAGSAFKDTWTLSDVDEAWHGEIADRNPPLYEVIKASRLSHGTGMMSYLIMMGVRLLEMKRLLKPTGSIYLHCDPTASHYLKLLMDSVLGSKNFRNEIVWHYHAGTAGKYRFGRRHDYLLYYRMSSKSTHNRIGIPVVNEKRYNKVDEDGRLYHLDGHGKKYYLDDGATCDDVWTWAREKRFHSLNSQSKERLGYPTQKPLALLERIIKASSNPDDLVLDPFCGCATACVAAEKLGRRWVGIDLSDTAKKLLFHRLPETRGVVHRTDIPIRSDLLDLPNYRTHKHTLYGLQEGICNGCRTNFPFRNFTVDHIVPKSKGGRDNPENLQLLCGFCNSKKGDRTMEYLLAENKREGILL